MGNALNYDAVSAKYAVIMMARTATHNADDDATDDDGDAANDDTLLIF